MLTNKRISYKFIKITFLIIIILLLLSVYVSFKKLNKNKYEQFSNKYLSNTIQLTKEAYKPIKISVGYEGGNYNKIITNISTVYPLIKINHNGASFKNVSDLVKGNCDLCICQLDAALAALNGDYPFKKEHTNLRFICKLYLETATLIAAVNKGINSWKYLKGKTVCIGKKTFSSYYNFMILAKTAGFVEPEKDINIIEDSIFSKNILNKFINNEIDCLYITTPHPRKDIYDLYIKKRFKIIGIEGLNKDLIKLRLPDFKPIKIDLTDYNIGNEQTKKFVDSLGISSCLITTKKISNNYIYKLIKTIFNNLEKIKEPVNEVDISNNDIPTKSTKSTKNIILKNLDQERIKKMFYKRIMSKILPSQILNFPSNMKIHEGAKNYYKDIGIISNIDNYNCANYAGSKRCFSEKKNKPHFGHGSIVKPKINLFN